MTHIIWVTSTVWTWMRIKLFIRFLIEAYSKPRTNFWTISPFLVKGWMNYYMFVDPLKRFSEKIPAATEWNNKSLISSDTSCVPVNKRKPACGVSIIIVVSASMSLSTSRPSVTNSSSSGMSLSVTQEFVSLVTANFALFGHLNVPDSSFEQQKPFIIDEPQKPGHGPELRLASKLAKASSITNKVLCSKSYTDLDSHYNPINNSFLYFHPSQELLLIFLKNLRLLKTTFCLNYELYLDSCNNAVHKDKELLIGMILKLISDNFHLMTQNRFSNWCYELAIWYTVSVI